TFSAEEGTAAHSLPNQLPQEVMAARRDALMKVQQPISLKKNRAQLGKVVEVLIEQENPTTGEFIGRCARFAPEVDGLVRIQGDAPLGAITPVEITDADIYDLYGFVVSSPLLVVC
ncbi:MAG: TRAM domain-containing protein, partial [Merismopedia sp. SIO2A8]|nr:TRAM domain-containing protein [Merismopedia sp. SIO2A8]